MIVLGSHLRATHLQKVLSVVPREICRKVFSLHVHSVMSAESLLITVEDNLVLAGGLDADSVINERLARVDYKSGVSWASMDGRRDVQLKMNNSPALSKTSILSVSFLSET